MFVTGTIIGCGVSLTIYLTTDCTIYLFYALPKKAQQMFNAELGGAQVKLECNRKILPVFDNIFK